MIASFRSGTPIRGRNWQRTGQSLLAVLAAGLLAGSVLFPHLEPAQRIFDLNALPIRIGLLAGWMTALLAIGFARSRSRTSRFCIPLLILIAGAGSWFITYSAESRIQKEYDLRLAWMDGFLLIARTDFGIVCEGLATGLVAGGLLMALALAPPAGPMRQTAGLLAVAGFVLLLVTKGLDRLEQLQIPLPRRHALAHFQPQSLARNPFSSCRPAAILRGHTSPIAAVAFLDSGQTLLSAGRDGNLRFWDIRSGTCHRTMPTVSGKLLAFSLSPDKRLLATAHDDSLVRVWNLNKQQLEFVLQGHEGPVSCITFSSDQQQLASGGKDGTIRLWNLEKQGCRHVLPGSHAAISCVAFAPDDATIAGGDERGTVCTWSAGSGHQLRTLNRQGSPAAATAVAFSPSNSGLLACTYTDSRLRVWDTSSGDLVLTGERNSVRLTAVAFRPDSRIAATGSKDHSVGIWDLDQRCLVGHLPGPEPTSGDWLGRVTCLAFDDSGGLLAVGHIDSVIRMWDLRTALRPKQRLPARKASGGPAGTANAGPGDRRSKHKASGSPHRN